MEDYTFNTIRLITCNNLQEAHIIKGRLNNEGVDCFLTNQNFTSLMPVYNNMLGGGIQVIIREDDLSKAKQLLKDKLEPDNADLVCPNCGSTDIGLGIGKQKGIKIFNMLISVFMTIPFGNLKPKYYCRACKKEIR